MWVNGDGLWEIMGNMVKRVKVAYTLIGRL